MEEFLAEENHAKQAAAEQVAAEENSHLNKRLVHILLSKILFQCYPNFIRNILLESPHHADFGTLKIFVQEGFLLMELLQTYPINTNLPNYIRIKLGKSHKREPRNSKNGIR